MNNKEMYRKKIDDLNCCVIMPTYNNEKTLEQVIDDLLNYTSNIIIVNDGSTDTTSEILNKFSDKLTVSSYLPNKGKGMALRIGIAEAITKGYRYAITIDSDGQHFVDDLTLFIDKIEQQPDSLIIGARNINQENMPRKNSFANKFSNFWFAVQTGIKLPDTQSGFRLYPLDKIKNTTYFSSKYEFEIEVMVKAAWSYIPVESIPIRVYYAEAGERITHFRPGRDFFRISVLNTYLVILALLWYKPISVFKKINKQNIKLFFQKNFLDANESILKKSISVAFGVFMGIVPIWGYQLMSALILAHFLKLNKVIVGVAANISIPPMIPLLLYGSLETGYKVLGNSANKLIFNSDISFELIKQHLYTYVVGSVVFSIIMAFILGLLTYIVLKIWGKKILVASDLKLDSTK